VAVPTGSGAAASVAEALEIARRERLRPPVEYVPLAEAAGRVLASDVRAAVAAPPWTTSAMDGWALRAADTPGDLPLAGESAAGAPFSGVLEPGRAVRISTGAVVPAGADAIVRLEDGAEQDGRLRAPATPAGAHVRAAGELLARGGTLLPAGERVAPHAVGAIGAVGLASVPCIARPRVAILATGRELATLGSPLTDGRIHDSNRHGIRAQLEAAGALVVSSEVLGDDRAATSAAIERLLAGAAEVVVTLGGMGRGPHDHVRPALAGAGVEALFDGLRATSLQPTWLGRRATRLALGLPGNPASAAIAVHVVGRELLGLREPWDRTLPLVAPWAREPGRADLLMCRLAVGGIAPLPDQRSHAVVSLARADALAWVEEGRGSLAAGEAVPFSPLA